MASDTYTVDRAGTQVGDRYDPDTVTVAQTVHPNLYLTKIFYRDKVQTYDNVKTFNFYEYQVEHLDDLARIVLKMLEQPRCCLLRAVPKDKTRRVLRRINGDDATLIEQPQHWFAIDVDGYAESTGDVRTDAETVLAGLGWTGTDCFAIASASYGVKPGIRLRMFFWANRKVECIVLKKLLMNNKVCADLAMFFPIQPIYVAKPIFADGLKDTVEKRFALLAGEKRCVEVPWNLEPTDRYSERMYSKRQAKLHLKKAFENVMQAESGSRHDVLINMGIWMGKLIAQDVLDQDDAIETLYDATLTWGDGNSKRDRQNILDGIKNGIMKMEGEL
jgi:hypothetical protein